MDLFDSLVTVGFWIAVFRIATPLIFGVLGELLCERAGVLNLGIEGIMTMGAMCAWIVVFNGGDLWLGVAVATGAGMMCGLVHSLWTVRWGISQPVVGIAMTLLAANLSYFVVRMTLPGTTTPPKIETFQTISIPFLDSIPFVGAVLASFTWYTYAALALVPLLMYALYRTPMGLAVRTVGENPHAAEAQGLSVYMVRTLAVMCGSGLMAIGGAFLTTAAFDTFYFGMVNGRGWICIALVILASWRPGKALIIALLFGVFDALQLRMQHHLGDIIPFQFFLMMPFILCILALLIISRRATYPKALLVPYRKGEPSHM